MSDQRKAASVSSISQSSPQARGRRTGPRKSDQTREAILTAALEFLRDHPFRDLTVGNLMRDTDASRPTFYQYFNDLHELMGVLLGSLRDDILNAAAPWFTGEGDPIPRLKVSLEGLVKVCYERGTLLRAVQEASVSDAGLEKSWQELLQGFDDAVATTIEREQSQGVIQPFAAQPVAIALNRLDAALMIEHFGRHPRANQTEVLAAITRIWCSTLYGVNEA